MTIEQIEQHVRRLLCKKDFTVYNPDVDGTEGVFYVDKETGTIYIWDGSEYIPTSVPASITGFNTMAAATLALGVGRFFYYNEANLDGATPGSLHITI